MQQCVLLFEKTIAPWTIRCVRGIPDENLNRFIAETYHSKSHYDFSMPVDVLAEKLRQDDLIYGPHSLIYTIYDASGNIQATIRKIYTTGTMELPIETEFDIPLLDTVKDHLPVTNIIEVARFASRSNRPDIIRLLLSESLSDSGMNDLLLASLDEKVLRSLRRIGFPWQDIGEARHYLGSLTCPVAVSIRDISPRVVSFEARSA